MAEYGLLVSQSSEMFSDFSWQIRNLWDSMPWGMPIQIGLGVVILAYFLLRNR